ncbi:MAG: CoA-disulfide reductase [Bacteroidales bacterium]|jgi:NADPH-dependent 2,4-dienoyl-CoA reductase/sulfur reductase-like enzyme/peroxiredoxin family protein/rhodanese-related sulfurtransferase/TusA-related sulfurtransferase|nr:CoA-disulfide reductase [Bacteroidales bacterium]
MKYLIIGGVAGGATVAARLRRLDEKASIILFERGQYVSYANCGLPYYIGDVIKERENLLLQTPEGFKERFNVEVRTGNEVLSIDPAARTVTVKELNTGSTYTESYDKLVLSPGAEPLRPPIPGIESDRIFTLRNIPDTDRIKTAVESGTIRSAAIIGGGFIGLEMAENLREKGLHVTVVEMADQVMAPLDYSMAAIVHQHLRDKQVDLVLRDGVKTFEEISDGITVNLNSGRAIETDMVLLSIGVRPETGLAAQAGLTIGESGGIRVNSYMQTSDKDIYALGDAVEIMNPLTGKPARIPLAGPANKQGRIVANNIVSGNKEEYKGTIGTSIARIFDLTVAATGLNAKQLKREGIPYRSSYTHGSSHAGYYPGALPMSIKILFSPADGRLLGAQAIGYDGVDKRIDIFAQVIGNGGTIRDLTTFEHAYAPPYSSAKDPVNIAGFVADNILTGKMETAHWREIASTESLIVDVRTKEEFEMGHIPGSVNIPLDELRGRISELPTDKPIVLTCAIGLRGYAAYRILTQEGFRNIRNLSGGYKTWSAATGASSPVLCVSPPSDSESSSDPTDILEVDACGLQCPGPILRLKKHYDDLKTGEQLLIRATDGGFAKDVSSWCNMYGARLLQLDINKGVVEARVEKQAPVTDRPSKESADGQTLIVFSNDLDKAIAAFILANGGAAAGKKVSLFFTFWGLTILKKQEKVSVRKDWFGTMFGWMLPSNSRKLKLSKMNMGGIGRKFMRLIMKKKNVYSLETLIAQARENNVEMIACTMSMDVMGIRAEELIDGVTLGGVANYIEKAERSNINMFI